MTYLSVDFCSRSPHKHRTLLPPGIRSCSVDVYDVTVAGLVRSGYLLKTLEIKKNLKENLLKRDFSPSRKFCPVSNVLMPEGLRRPKTKSRMANFFLVITGDDNQDRKGRVLLKLDGLNGHRKAIPAAVVNIPLHSLLDAERGPHGRW